MLKCIFIENKTMTNYVAFNAQHAINYINSLIESNQYDFFKPGQALAAYEFGDGNLNLVFRITDEQKKQYYIKASFTVCALCR